MPGDWLIERRRAPAAELHDAVPPGDGARRIWVLEPTAPAVVLGSTQRDDAVDAASAGRAGVDVVRRRSGGGAVFVSPGEPVWIDVVLPRHDPRWDDDVARSFLPIGRAWQLAVEAVGIGGTAVHDGPIIHTEWSRLVCFAGRGPGEVLVGDGKVVGMSQRRTRAGARFQCALPRVWSAEPLRSLLRPSPPAGALDHCGAGIGDVAVGDLVDAFVAAFD